jgi:hypothetical protein
MLRLRGIPRTIASALAAVLLVALLCGGSCTVAVCKEDCDPCIEQCVCSGTCANGIDYDYRTVHRLSSYSLATSADGEGALTRTFSDIVGLSLDRAQGPVPHAAGDYARFAEAVIDVNAWLLAPGGRAWTAEPVLSFDSAVVVPFHGEDETERLELLFDGGANLAEIHLDL